MVWTWCDFESSQPNEFSIYDLSAYGRSIVLPEQPSAEERTAAGLLAKTLSQASGGRVQFHVVSAALVSTRAHAIFVGECATKKDVVTEVPRDRWDRRVSFAVSRNSISLRATHREDIAQSVSLFLEHAIGARWFMPGPNGVEVRLANSLRLAPTELKTAGAYFSRNLAGAAPGTVGSEWFLSNRLTALLTHGHTAAKLVSPADLARRPDFAPWLEDRRFIPPLGSIENWQPDLQAIGLAEFVAEKAAAELRANPHQASFAFGQNDTHRFDQSPHTLVPLQPEQFFRSRPDYSNLLFSFLNQLAVPLARDFPDRVLTTYAYYWTENTPRFPVAPNIVPFLTADRSGWFDPEFAANDRDLIARWGRSGTKFFALYDYLYGSPYLVPRPTLGAISDPIPYAYRQGARGYYAEMTPNWALDGPKPWLAAQLLWDPAQDSARLLDEYYARFWREAAVPMRAFYERCDLQWRNQPLPAVWIKFFRDEDQRVLFPPDVREILRGYLADAHRRTAPGSMARTRVEFVSAGFAVTEAFCAYVEDLARFNRLNLQAAPPTTELVDSWRSHTSARENLIATFNRVKRDFPLAIQTPNLGDYLRSDPRQSAARTLALRGELTRVTPEMLAKVFLDKAPPLTALVAPGRELIMDSGFKTLVKKDRHPFFLTDWSERGPWLAKSEPQEHLRIEFLNQSDGGRSIRYSGCNMESLWQWNLAKPGALYLATVQIRGHVSPGNVNYLLVTLFDKDGKHVDRNHTCRLPIGDWPDWVTLQVLVRAPGNTASVSGVLRTLYQVPGDWVEWKALSLREIVE